MGPADIDGKVAQDLATSRSLRRSSLANGKLRWPVSTYMLQLWVELHACKLEVS
jgi:hypothetical protein